jgi:hypothetical protein
MNKRILDYSYQSSRSLHSFYPNVDTLESLNHSKYDIIICNRDNIQDDFSKIFKYINNKTKLIVDIVQESGNLDNFIEYFNILTRTYNNINFYLLVDSEFDFKFNTNVKCLKSYKLSFLAFFENFCIHPHDSQLILKDLNIYKKENGILSLNGSMRTQRIILLSELISRKYINNDGSVVGDNFISFLLYNDNVFKEELYNSFLKGMVLNGDISDTQYNILSSIKNKLPIKIEGEDGNRPDIELKHFYKKIINLVTENTAGYDDSDNTKYGTITFTEKAWKPFKTHQLPLYISLSGYVDKIRSLGFDVFDDFINHSYDTVKDHKLRLKLVLDELDRVNKLDCLGFYKKNYNRFVKNCSNIYKLKSEAYLELQNFIFKYELI